MDTFSRYSLEVKRPLELLQELLDDIPIGSKISFEGRLRNHLASKAQYSESEEGLLRRNTRTPRQEFWVFTIDESNRGYLRNELLHQIGLNSNVIT